MARRPQTARANEAPSLTVVVCCFSSEAFFEDAVSSIVAQSYHDYKIVFHDNGAPASYAARIDRVAKRLGAEIIRSDFNRYGEGLRFDVLPHLVTPYMALLHDDDEYVPNKLERSMEELRKGGHDYVFTDRHYTDAGGRDLDDAFGEINMRPFLREDFPYQFIADAFYRGLRFHFSTFVCRTSLAKETLLGDPFLPRIADSLFAARLLIDRRYSGVALPERLTRVKVHGGNDMLYSKFSAEERGREEALLSFAEYYIFRDLVDRCDDRQLRSLFACYPGIQDAGRGDRTATLLQAALLLPKDGRAKKLMATHCVHQAFAREPLRALSLFREMSGSDTNRFMIDTYNQYMSDEVWSYGQFLRRPQELSSAGSVSSELAPIRSDGPNAPAERADDSALQSVRSRYRDAVSSKTWRLSGHLRNVLRRLRGQAPIRGEDQLLLQEIAEPYEMGDWIALQKVHSVRYLAGGFSPSEPWGRWTLGPTATLLLKTTSENRDATIVLWVVHAFTRDGLSPELSVAVNGRPIGRFPVKESSGVSIPIPAAIMAGSGLLLIDLKPSQVKSAADQPHSESRLLGIGVEGLKIVWTSDLLAQSA